MKPINNVAIFSAIILVLIISVTYNLNVIFQPPTLIGIVDHKNIGEGTDDRGEPITWYTVSVWLITDDEVNGYAVGETFAYIVDKGYYDKVETGDVVKGIPLQSLNLEISEVLSKSKYEILTWQRTGGFIGLDEELIVRSDGQVSYESPHFGNSQLFLTELKLKDLIDRLDSLSTYGIFSAKSGVADYYSYKLIYQSSSGTKTIEWVDAWASKEDLPKEVGMLQLDIESIIGKLHEQTGSLKGADERAVETAKVFIIQAPTFMFDGISDTLQVTDVSILESFPVQYIITIKFDSRAAGYGDRTGQGLAQVITPHIASVKVVNDNIVSAILDDQWDELRQQSIEG